MPAFTYVASIIVAEVIGIAGAAILGSAGLAFVTSAIALGLAVVTSRLIAGSGGGSGGTAQDPGVRVQFPPATNNKVPVVYGSAYTKGVITDARLSNENKTMTYVLVLSEKTQTGTYSIGEIYWNDAKLVFDGDNNEAHIVRSSIDQNGQGESSTNYDGLIRVRVYAGSTAATDQIFPPQATGNTENARTLLGESDTNYLLNGLVFAVLQLDYSSEKGTTGLGQVTFQVINSLKNPGLVWYDYITSARYGAGFPVAQVNTETSISSSNTLSLYSISNTIPPTQYVPWPFTTSTTYTATNQVRYEMNGVLSTGDTVKNNLDKINLSCAAWTTYDFSEGKWKVIPNRAATGDELAAAFEFNDDNIIGEIGLTSTNLEDLFNQLEVEYASRNIRDQNDYFKAEIAAGERNTLEPDNNMNLRLEMCNNAIHAARVGLIELKQSRIDKVITFTADYSALQVEAGDVVKITNSVYDFDQKLFRISKTRELEGEDGSITVEITALEYDANIYADEELYDSTTPPGSGIPSFVSSLPAPSAPQVILSVPNTTVPYFVLTSTVATNSVSIDSYDFYYSTASGGVYNNLISVNGNYSPNQTFQATINTLNSGTYYFKARTGAGPLRSTLSDPSSEFTWTPIGGGFDGGEL